MLLLGTECCRCFCFCLYLVSPGLRAVVTGCPKLTRLEVTGCSGPFAVGDMLQPTPPPATAAAAASRIAAATTAIAAAGNVGGGDCGTATTCASSSSIGSSSGNGSSSSSSSSTPGDTAGYTSHRWQLQELQLCSGPCTATSQQVLQLLGLDQYDHFDHFDQSITTVDQVDRPFDCEEGQLSDCKHYTSDTSAKPFSHQQQPTGGQQGLALASGLNNPLQNPRPCCTCHLQVLALVGLRGVCDVLLQTLAKLGCSKLQHLRLEECYRHSSSSSSSSTGNSSSSSSISSSSLDWYPSFSATALLSLVSRSPQLRSLRLRHATAPLPAPFVMAVAGAAPLLQVGVAGRGLVGTLKKNYERIFWAPSTSSTK
jgi:hypothetical protein